MTKKHLTALIKNLEHRLVRRKNAPAGMIYQIKKHRKVLVLEAQLAEAKAALADTSA